MRKQLSKDYFIIKKLNILRKPATGNITCTV